MAHGHNPIINHEIDCGNTSVNKSQSSISAVVAAAANSVGSGNNNPPLSGSNTKMGSRRIFTPQFKLQVLASYRNDSDCKGNQRATARKYGIHRRQIQKWLQCESSLKSSVANSNQNVRQFHNINNQMTAISSAGATQTSNTNNHHNQQYKSNVLSLDTARHSVALPTSSSCIPPPTIGTAAVAAAAAMAATAANRAAPTTTKCVNGSKIATQAKSNATNIIVLPPHKINQSATGQTHTPAVRTVPLYSHHQLHHHNNHHIQQQQQQQHHHHHNHNHHQQQQQHESTLMSTACLPLPGSPVLSATNPTHELRDYKPIITQESVYMNENYMNRQIYENLTYYNNPPSPIPAQKSPVVVVVNGPIDLSLGPRRRDYSNIVAAAAAATTATSENSDRDSNNYDKPSLLKLESWQEIENNNNNIKKERQDYECLSDTRTTVAVDLTCRKRSSSAVYTDATSPPPPEKVQKFVDSNKEGIAEARQQQQSTDQDTKPVKLFKPYLLGGDDDNKDKEKRSPSNCDQNPIIWSNHPTCLTSPGYESQSSHSSSNFQSPNDAYTFPIGSPTFQSYACDRNTPPEGSAASSPNSIAATSSPLACITTFWCPKGSPVSGYDTASTYSDSSEYHNPQHYISSSNHHQSSQYQQHHPPQPCSINFKWQVIDSYYHDMTCRGDSIAVAGKYNVPRNDVQRWLDQETDIRISGKELPIM